VPILASSSITLGDGGKQRREKMKYDENEFDTSSGSWLLSFILGGLIGAAVALLVAPRSGRQTREQIKDIAEEAKEKAADYYDKAKDQISTAMQKGAEILEQKKAEVESRVSGVKEAYRKATGTTTAE
jgi:gas vesicle protein